MLVLPDYSNLILEPIQPAQQTLEASIPFGETYLGYHPPTPKLSMLKI